MKNIYKGLPSFWATIIWCLALSWKSSKLYTIIRIAADIITPLLTIFAAFVGKHLLDLLSGSWVVTDTYPILFLLFGLLFAIALVRVISDTAPFLGYQDFDVMGQGTIGEKRPYNVVGNRHSMYRFHIMDPIRFESDFKAVMQAIGWRSEERYLPLCDDISSVAYWYQLEPHVTFEKLGSRDELEIV